MSFGVGIVYSKDGTPRIDPDFIAHLTPIQRAWVAADLDKHGYKLTDQNEVIKNGDSLNGGA